MAKSSTGTRTTGNTTTEEKTASASGRSGPYKKGDEVTALNDNKVFKIKEIKDGIAHLERKRESDDTEEPEVQTSVRNLEEGERVAMTQEIEHNDQFKPGETVSIHELEQVRIEEGGSSKPMPAPITTTTVKGDGSVEVSGLDPGTYTASSPVTIQSLAANENVDLQVPDVEKYHYVTFSVKEDD